MGENGKLTAKRPKRIAIYVIYDKDGILDGYRKYYLQELRKEVDFIVGVVSGTLTPGSRKELEELTDDFFVRENVGLLAYGWIDGIAHIGWDELENYDELLMLNDSFFGPFFPLRELFEAMEESDADFYGAIKNYEDKNITKLSGRTLKHGHLRGSICYFYVIKKNLLHSAEFKKYWSSKPVIKENWDTVFFNEFDFFDYVIDAGFKVDAYQSDSLNRYCYDTCTCAMSKLIRNDRMPFARIRPFATDMKQQSLHLNYGKDVREAFEYIDKSTNYDVNLIWDYILRTKNLTDIFNQLQLEYVVSKDYVEQNYAYKEKIAVIIHIYYEDLVEDIADYCENFVANTVFFVTTTDEKTKRKIDKAFEVRKLKFECKVRPNVGAAMSTLWITYADVVVSGAYEYICYFHDKKSPYWGYEVEGEQFGKRCYENLVGSEAIVKNIINIFEKNPRLGILGPTRVYHGHYFNVAMTTWSINYENTVELANRLDLNVAIDKNIVPVAPYGDMFWFRADALKKAIGYGFTYDDFDFKYIPDGTILHAIERCYGFMAQDSGYYYAEVINDDHARADLINYQYMISTICALVYKDGFIPYSFEEVLNIIRYRTDGKSYDEAGVDRKIIKQILKRKIPKPIWAILKKIYHIFGGKKWVG